MITYLNDPGHTQAQNNNFKSFLSFEIPEYDISQILWVGKMQWKQLSVASLQLNIWVWDTSFCKSKKFKMQNTIPARPSILGLLTENLKFLVLPLFGFFVLRLVLKRFGRAIIGPFAKAGPRMAWLNNKKKQKKTQNI